MHSKVERFPLFARFTMFDEDTREDDTIHDVFHKSLNFSIN